MKLRCITIDDEPLAHDVIAGYIDEIPFLEHTGKCFRATEALDFLSKHEVDLIFLDIRMPKLNGLEFLRTLHQVPLVIITSAYEEYALESFDLAVCDYLLKPIRFERMLKAANRALEFHKLKQVGVQPVVERTAQIQVKTDKKVVLVPVSSISLVEGLGNYVKIWQEDAFLLTQGTMTAFEVQLAHENFVRIHKSFLVNKSHIHYLEGNTIYLKKGRALPVGKSYRATIKETLK